MCFTNTVATTKTNFALKSQESRAQIKLIAIMVRPNKTFSIKHLKIYLFSNNVFRYMADIKSDCVMCEAGDAVCGVV